VHRSVCAESFGLVALEAAACVTPVVAASVGGLRSLVDDGTTGFLVEGRDPAAYAAPVATLLDDPALAAEIGATASARSRRYSWSTTAARLRRLYGDLVARGLVRCDDPGS
jgi:D-inositol-3-phosphate glycosyltransferase